jgi:putative membrane protein
MTPNNVMPKLTNELAKERSREASDRTLMAWIRTSISLIGFGFAIAKSYEYLDAEYTEKTGKALEAIPTPIIFGASFMMLGLLGVLAGVVQYRRMLKKINSDQFVYSEPLPLPQLIAIGLLIIGVFGFVMVVI